jgi:hypothetical protein
MSDLLPTSVHIGAMDKRELLRTLRERGVQFNRSAEVLFEDPRFTTLSERKTIEIAAVCVGALGFEGGATYEQLTARALQSGLLECPLELGPRLRLPFLHQPESPPGFPVTRKLGSAPPNSVTVASIPLDDRDETPKGFYLRKVDGVLWLRGYRSWPGHVWSPDDTFVFSRMSS